MNTLEYVTPIRRFADPRPTKAMAAIVLACWLVPLGCGLAALLGYGLSGYDIFAVMGALAFLGGGVAALVGLISAALTFSFSGRIEPEIRFRVRRRASRALVGILLNFPIAFACLIVGVSLPGRLAVKVTNGGASEISDIRLDLLGRQESIGDLGPGETWRGSLRVKYGRAAISWTSGEERHESVFTDHADGDTFWKGSSIKLVGSEAMWD